MTRAELYEAFLANPYLISLSNAMDRIKNPEAEPKPDAAFSEMMDRAFDDTSLTTQYLQEMLAGEFSNVILDERFGVYLRNCLRADLAELAGDTNVIYEP